MGWRLGGHGSNEINERSAINATSKNLTGNTLLTFFKRAKFAYITTRFNWLLIKTNGPFL
jgi:hypothetical protein